MNKSRGIPCKESVKFEKEEETTYKAMHVELCDKQLIQRYHTIVRDFNGINKTLISICIVFEFHAP